MGKPIKKWGVVKFLKDKVGDAGDQVLDVIRHGENPVKAVTDFVFGEGGKKLSPEDRRIALEMVRLDIEQQRLHNSEMANVRAMQIENLKHGDQFTKRFIYWYAGAMTALIFAVLIMLFFIEIPDENKQTVNMIIGVVIGSGLSGVFQYFFGSSSGSKEKQDMLKTVMDKLK